MSAEVRGRGCSLQLTAVDAKLHRSPPGECLSFAAADILHLENLWQFRSLVKLQVDNNIIERISGLESLTHLEWLGVSLSWRGLAAVQVLREGHVLLLCVLLQICPSITLRSSKGCPPCINCVT